MEAHILERHPNVDLDSPENRLAEKHFSMKDHKRYKTAMDRQLGKAICIAMAGGMDSRAVINLKNEYTRYIILISSSKV